VSATNPESERNRTAANRRGLIIAAVIAVVLALYIGGFLLFRSLAKSSFSQNADQMFGDQHLKTAVALIELHKVRYGTYPDSLRDLTFVGDWDRGALMNVRYVPGPDRMHYFVEVQRGWIGKPNLQLPDSFWVGTGYSASLKPVDR